MSDIQFIVSAFNCGSRGVELGKCINLMTGSRSWQCHNEFIVIRPHQFISCLLDILWKTLNYSDSLTMICQRLSFLIISILETLHMFNRWEPLYISELFIWEISSYSTQPYPIKSRGIWLISVKWYSSLRLLRSSPNSKCMMLFHSRSTRILLIHSG